MRAALLALLFVAACAGTQPAGVKPLPAGESRNDGIVTMSSVGTLYNPVSPVWATRQSGETGL